MQSLAWHYTTGRCYKLIVESGALLPTIVYVAPPERGILWFSLKRQWEPTANKAIMEGGKRRRLGMIETRTLDGGLFRFGVPRERLLRWRDLPRAASMSRRMTGALLKAAHDVGSNPALWLGSLDPIPLTEVAEIHTMNDAGTWTPVDRSV